MKNVLIGLTFFVVFASLVMSSCINFKKEHLTKEQKREKRARAKIAKLLKEFPDIIKSDSSEKVDTNRSNVDLEEDFYDPNKEIAAYNTIDSLRDALAKRCPELFVDTVQSLIIDTNKKSESIGDYYINKFKKAVTIETLLSPILIDTAGTKVYITAKGNDLKVKISLPVTTISKEKSKHTVVPCPECPELGYWEAICKLKWVIGILAGAILFLFFIIVVMK